MIKLNGWGQLVINRLAARAYAMARYPSVGERDRVVNVEGLLATSTIVLVQGVGQSPSASRTNHSRLCYYP